MLIACIIRGAIYLSIGSSDKTPDTDFDIRRGYQLSIIVVICDRVHRHQEGYGNKRSQYIDSAGGREGRHRLTRDATIAGSYLPIICLS
jgi:hypothetical protein